MHATDKRFDDGAAPQTTGRLAHFGWNHVDQSGSMETDRSVVGNPHLP